MPKAGKDYHWETQRDMYECGEGEALGAKGAPCQLSG